MEGSYQVLGTKFAIAIPIAGSPSRIERHAVLEFARREHGYQIAGIEDAVQIRITICSIKNARDEEIHIQLVNQSVAVQVELRLVILSANRRAYCIDIGHVDHLIAIEITQRCNAVRPTRTWSHEKRRL